MKKLFIFILPIYFTNIFSQDIIVDNSVQYNVTNQYAKFDRYSKHGGFSNYKYENKDRISLPENFPALGSIFRLTENDLVTKLEQLVDYIPGIFEIRETAGMHQLYIQNVTPPEGYLIKHYSDAGRREAA